MNMRQSIYIVIGTAVAYAIWEVLGHPFTMLLPMAVRHLVSGGVGTALALIIAAVAVRTILCQEREVLDLARLRDYLLRMEAHYLRLPPSAHIDPQQHFVSQARGLQFADAQRRFASQDPFTRANAAITLAQMAQERWPGSSGEGTEGNYPFFARAASNLTAALYLEKERMVRAEVLKALEKMALFAGQTDQALLHGEIDEIAHANRCARDAFVDALARYCARNEESRDDRLRRLLAFTQLCQSEEATLLLLQDLTESQKCRDAIAAYRSLQSAAASEGEEAAKPDEGLLQEIQTDAAYLADTHDALVHCLRALAPPADLPTDRRSPGTWKRPRPLPLAGCILVGAALQEVSLPGADLQEGHLQGAILSDAKLQRADLTEAHLQRAQLVGAQLQGAKLREARLQDATLTSAALQDADLSRAQLPASYLIGAQLEGACLWQIVVEEEPGNTRRRADFTRANWWEARFNDSLTGSTDTAAANWLKVLFPPPAGKTEAAPAPASPVQAA